MSRLFEALQQSGLQTQERPFPVQHEPEPVELQPEIKAAAPVQPDRARTVAIHPAADLPVFTEENGVAAEKFRLLAFKLQQLQERAPFKRLLVTSSVVQDGKSLISANLALAMAAREKCEVLLIGGDLRQPRLNEIFGIGNLPGLGDWMDQQHKPISDYLYRVEGSQLWLLPAGASKLSALEILHSERLRSLMDELSSRFEYIVIDSPPVLAVADAHVWETLSEATLLVVRERKTPKKMLEKTLETIDRSKLVGAVLNEATFSQQKYYGYYGYYGSPSEARELAKAAGEQI